MKILDLENGIYEDGTYKMRKGINKIFIEKIEFKKGYQFSLWNGKGNTFTIDNKDIENMLKADLINLEQTYLGVFKGKFEFSYWTKKKKEAIKNGIAYNQFSIWDWKKGKEIIL